MLIYSLIFYSADINQIFGDLIKVIWLSGSIIEQLIIITITNKAAAI